MIWIQIFKFIQIIRPFRSPAWRQGAASPAQLTEVATTEATAEAAPAALAEEARTEAARGRGGKIIPPEPHLLRMLTTVSPFSNMLTLCASSLSIMCHRLFLVNIF